MSRIEELIAERCPDGVPFVSLADVARTVAGLSGKTKADFSEGNARFVSYRNVFSNLSIVLDAPDYVKVATTEKQNTLHEGDVIFTGSSESLAEVGMSSAVVTEPLEPLYLNSFCFAVRFADSAMFDPHFSKHLFRSESVRRQIQRSASGVTRINISKERFMKIRIPVPPVEVQREIASTLDLFTELEAELEAELQAELQARRKQYAYVRDQLLTFPEASVRTVTMPEIARNLDSRRRPVTRDAREVGDYPYYGASGVVDRVSDFIFDGDYLLVSEDGANLLARSTPIAFSISGKSWVNNHAHILDFDSYASRRFVEIYLNSIDLSPYLTGSAQPKLNQASLNKIAIPWPSAEDRERIVDVIDKLDALINDVSIGLPAELRARRKQYEHYRDRLLTFEEAA